jgi:hypothetical protein
MLDLMQQELEFSRGEALTLASLTVDLIRRPAFTYRSSSVPGKPLIRTSERQPCQIRGFGYTLGTTAEPGPVVAPWRVGMAVTFNRLRIALMIYHVRVLRSQLRRF